MYLKKSDTDALVEFLRKLNDQAAKEFHEWDVFNGHPSFLTDQMQDLSYFMHLLSPPEPTKKYDYDCDALIHPYGKKIRWLATEPSGEVYGYSSKPRKINNNGWFVSAPCACRIQKHIKGFKGNWKESLEKVNYDKG